MAATVPNDAAHKIIHLTVDTFCTVVEATRQGNEFPVFKSLLSSFKHRICGAGPDEETSALQDFVSAVSSFLETPNWMQEMEKLKDEDLPVIGLFLSKLDDLVIATARLEDQSDASHLGSLLSDHVSDLWRHLRYRLSRMCSNLLDTVEELKETNRLYQNENEELKTHNLILEGEKHQLTKTLADIQMAFDSGQLQIVKDLGQRSDYDSSASEENDSDSSVSQANSISDNDDDDLKDDEELFVPSPSVSISAFGTNVLHDLHTIAEETDSKDEQPEDERVRRSSVRSQTVLIHPDGIPFDEVHNEMSQRSLLATPESDDNSLTEYDDDDDDEDEEDDEKILRKRLSGHDRYPSTASILIHEPQYWISLVGGLLNDLHEDALNENLTLLCETLCDEDLSCSWMKTFCELNGLELLVECVNTFENREMTLSILSCLEGIINCRFEVSKHNGEDSDDQSDEDDDDNDSEPQVILVGLAQVVNHGVCMDAIVRIFGDDDLAVKYQALKLLTLVNWLSREGFYQACVALSSEDVNGESDLSSVNEDEVSFPLNCLSKYLNAVRMAIEEGNTEFVLITLRFINSVLHNLNYEERRMARDKLYELDLNVVFIWCQKKLHEVMELGEHARGPSRVPSVPGIEPGMRDDRVILSSCLNQVALFQKRQEEDGQGEETDSEEDEDDEDDDEDESESDGEESDEDEDEQDDDDDDDEEGDEGEAREEGERGEDIVERNGHISEEDMQDVD